MANPFLGLKYNDLALQNEGEEVVRVINLNEKRCVQAVREYIEAGKAVCECEECVLDILALTLNNTPSRYIVNDIHMNCFGEQNHKPDDEELAKIVENAGNQVAKRPHH